MIQWLKSLFKKPKELKICSVIGWHSPNDVEILKKWKQDV
jgi:hypothetical protein